nr:putative ribonuclease H-like domain-containing protein [Tanacetum cinerariifolium]
LTQSKLVSNTAVRSVSADLPNITMTCPRHAHQVVTKSKSPIRWHLTRNPSSRTSNSPLRVNVVQVLVVSAAQGNMSYLSDFKELNGGYVAFGGNPKGDKITGKGKIKIGKLDFDNVYFVKELKFNLFSVSQMCDKKNSVLFTDTECLVLSSEFKLPDESQVLVRVPREHNMYNDNLKNIVPCTGSTWLFDIDSLTRTMNYQPVHTGNQNNSGAGFQDNLDAKKAGEEVDQSYMLFPGSAQSKEQDDKTMKEVKGKSPIESVT